MKKGTTSKGCGMFT